MLALCRAGTFAFVLTARQMGKSSLMVRTAEALFDEGIRSVIIDLTRIGKQVTSDQWYVGLLVVIQEQLGLSTDAAEWWGQYGDQGPVQRLTRFLEEVVLTEVKERVTVFVDEIDTTLGMGFTDDFYAAIRYLYNARARNAELVRLSFVLVGVASPGDLIQDERRTPFNLGQRVELTDFTLEEAAPLAVGLGSTLEEGRRVLEWAMAWTGGHPYLTQRLCQALVDHHEQGMGNWSRLDVDRVVERTFFSERSFQDNNLVFVRDMLTRRAPDPERVLRTYQDVRRGWRVRDEDRSLIKAHLKLSGVVCQAKGMLRVRNAIYERVFTVSWAGSMLPVDWRIVRYAILGLVVTGFIVLLPAAVLLNGQLGDAEKARATAEHNSRVSVQARQEAEADANLTRTEANRDRQRAREEAEQIKQAAQDEQRIARAEVARSHLEVARLQREAWDAEAKKEQAEREIAAAKAEAASKLREAFSYVFLNKADATLRETSSALAMSAALAVEAVRRHESSAAMDLLIRSVLQLRRPDTASLEHAGNVLSVAFSPDGSFLLTAGEDMTARVWGMADKRPREVLLHEDAVTAVAISRDGRLAATSSDGGALRLWNTKTWKSVGELLAHDGGINALAFSPDGTRVATAGEDLTVRMWSTVNGKPLGEPLQHRSRITTLAFSPDGTTLATGSTNKTVLFWDVGTGKRVLKGLLQKARITSVAFSPDGNVLAIASEDKIARLVEVVTRRELMSFRHDKAVTSVTFSRDGGRVATASEDKTARLWDVVTGQQLMLMPHLYRVNSVALSSDGKTMATATEGRRALLWSLAPSAPLIHLPHGSPGRMALFSQDGRYVTTVGEDGRARFWNAATGTPLLGPLPRGVEIPRIHASQDGDPRVTLIESLRLKHDQSMGAIPVAGRESMGNAEEGVWVAAEAERLPGSQGPEMKTPVSNRGGKGPPQLDGNGVMQFLSLPADAQLSSPRPGGQGIADFHEGRAIVATTGNDNTARIWDASSGAPLGRPLKHALYVTALAFNRDGRILATGSEDSLARLWDVATGTELQKMRHDKTVTQVAFSPDGELLATSSEDGSVRLWNVSTGRRIAMLPVDSPVRSVTIHPDGSRLATVSEDGIVRLWPVKTADWIDLVCSLLPRNLKPEEWPADVREVVPYQKTCDRLP
ncbi:LpqB family beta-propeller domain-containing protein [Myxococcus sp. K38C18041901]|nr:LpqB family beta-propeller domain-containing protein [Myxococcus guangdongensis]